MSTQKLFERYYSDPKYDGTGTFYSWIRSLAKPTDRVLNLGAGPATNSEKRTLKGEVAEVVGADIDPAVLQNEELDRACLIQDGRLPLESSYFDLAFSDYVLEHVEHPTQFLAEVIRVLKPGGSFLFRTPNCYHYVTLISSLTPRWFQERVANRARGFGDDAHEPYPTFYRMNTRTRLRKLARDAGFGGVELRMIECEPYYCKFHVMAFMLGLAYERVVNSTRLLESCRVNIQGRLDKPL